MFEKKRKSVEKKTKKHVEKGRPKKDPKKGARGSRKSIISGPGRLFHPTTGPPRPTQSGRNSKKWENRGFRGQVDKKVEKKNEIEHQTGAMRGVCGR